MLAQLKPDPKIPVRIQQLASDNNLGMALKWQKKKFHVFVLFLLSISASSLIALFIYDIYPNIISLVHLNGIITNTNQNSSFSISSLFRFGKDFVFLTFIYFCIRNFIHERIYICTDGLLKISYKNHDAVRWDEIEELYTRDGLAKKLVRKDGSIYWISRGFVSSQKKFLNKLIIEEVNQRQLPALQQLYQNGKPVKFGGLRVNKHGLFCGYHGHIAWSDLGDIMLYNGKLLLYYPKSALSKHSSTSHSSKWYAWQRSDHSITSWPNLPIFMALVEPILAQQQAALPQPVVPATMPKSSKYLSRKEYARLIWKRNHQKKWAIYTASTVALIYVIVFGVYMQINYFTRQQQEQQRAYDQIRSTNQAITQWEQKQYYIFVPGEGCSSDTDGYWQNLNEEDTYQCQKDGLRMTQKDSKVSEETHFSFIPYNISDKDRQALGSHTLAHHYGLRVRIANMTGADYTCAGVGFRVQKNGARETFYLCSDYSWHYWSCDASCKSSTQLAQGALKDSDYYDVKLENLSKYYVDIDIADCEIAFRVNGIEVAVYKECTYSATDSLVLTLYGTANATEFPSAVFSEFSYTPVIDNE